jgi:predicted  nucleic acid-binding Zn-ribbon protein
MESSLKAAEAQISELEKSRDKLTETVENLEKQLKDSEEKLDLELKAKTALEKSQKAAESNMGEEKERILKLEKDKESLEKELNAVKSKVKEQDKELASLQKQSNNAADEIEEATKKLEKDLNKIQTERDGLLIGLQDANQQLQQAQAELNQVKKSYAEMESKLANQIVEPVAEIPEPPQSIIENEIDPADIVYTIVVRVLPGEDEFEVELPALFTGAEILAELMEAGVLEEDKAYELLVKRTGDYIGGEQSLFDSPVQENDLVIIQ